MVTNKEVETTDPRLECVLAKWRGFAKHVTAERVQAFGTLVIALVTLWTLFLTPVGDRLITEISQSLEDTQDELERHRRVSAKVTLRAVWSKLDDGLAENEYFARVAADYNAHVEWMDSPDGKGLRPSFTWLQLPYRDGVGRQNIGTNFEEPGRWGNRLKVMHDLWPFRTNREHALDPLATHKELRRYLDGLLDEHFGSGGYGAPATAGAVVEAMKRDEALIELGGPAADAVRGRLNEFLQLHATMTSKALRVQLVRPYSADEVVEAGEEVVRNVREFRDALREFVRDESSPYF